MRNTDQWMAQAREPYLKHYDEAFLKKQWADLCDVVVESVFFFYEAIFNSPESCKAGSQEENSKSVEDEIDEFLNVVITV